MNPSPAAPALAEEALPVVPMSTATLAALAVAGLILLARLAPLGGGVGWNAAPIAAGLCVASALLHALVLPRLAGAAALTTAAIAVTALAVGLLGLAHGTATGGRLGLGFVLMLVASWLAAWALIERLTAWTPAAPALARFADAAVPLVFGLFLFLLWEVVTVGFGVPMVLMPAPSQIALRLVSSLPILGADFVQTVVRAVIPGWAIGSTAGILVAIVADRIPFLGRGLMPLGNLVSALPMVGVAPIMVMWFGFDWPSKVAVVVINTFFPALVNTVAGLSAAGRLEHDLMRSWGTSWGTTLLRLRLPAAMPHVFAALKLNSTFALIAAIVAEFFGTPIVGMGFRISTEVGRMGLDMVWAEIAVAAVTGSTFYAVLAFVERRVTFWHPSNRGR
jgi:NitT/TauT family transport system permease protein